MTNRVTFSFSMGGNMIDAGIAALEKSIATMTGNVQKLAVSILRDWKQHNDDATAVRRANALVKALGKGMRANALRTWFEHNAPMVYNEQTKLLVKGSTAASPVREASKINLEVSTKALWHDADGGEAPYKPIADWPGQIAALIKRAKTDIEKQGDKSKVDPVQLRQLELLAAGAMKAKADPLA